MVRRFALPIALSFVFVTAGMIGCSDDTPPKPRVTFDSFIEPGTHTTKDCPENNRWFQIGLFGNPNAGQPVTPIDDGASDQQGTASVSCSVRETGDSFDVRATAYLSGATGGSVTIIGLFKATGDQTGIAVSMTKEGRTYTQADCVAKYDTQIGQGVAPGRVWASIICADAEAESLQRICKTSAQFRFENCGQ